jgi:hypothetical protein
LSQSAAPYRRPDHRSTTLLRLVDPYYGKVGRSRAQCGTVAAPARLEVGYLPGVGIALKGRRMYLYELALYPVGVGQHKRRPDDRNPTALSFSSRSVVTLLDTLISLGVFEGRDFEISGGFLSLQGNCSMP